MPVIGDASEDTLLTLTGATPIGPAPVVAFTANDPAVRLIGAATRYVAGFYVQNEGVLPMRIGGADTDATHGRVLPPGASMVISSSNAYLYYAYAAGATAGTVGGTVATVAS